MPLGRFRLFASSHILRNVARVMRTVEQSDTVIEGFISAIVKMCDSPGRRNAITGISDYEDNLIAALAKDPAVDALIIVTSDHDLPGPGPNWNGRLVIRPRDFVRRLVAR